MNIVIAIKGMMEEKFWKFKCPTYVNVGTKIHPQGWLTHNPWYSSSRQSIWFTYEK